MDAIRRTLREASALWPVNDLVDAFQKEHGHKPDSVFLPPPLMEAVVREFTAKGFMPTDGSQPRHATNWGVVTLRGGPVLRAGMDTDVPDEAERQHIETLLPPVRREDAIAEIGRIALGARLGLVIVSDGHRVALTRLFLAGQEVGGRRFEFVADAPSQRVTWRIDGGAEPGTGASEAGPTARDDGWAGAGVLWWLDRVADNNGGTMQVYLPSDLMVDVLNEMRRRAFPLPDDGSQPIYQTPVAQFVLRLAPAGVAHPFLTMSESAVADGA